MKILTFILSATILAGPILASGAEARSVTANQLSAWGHGRRPTLTNRPSWDIYRRNRYDGPHHHGRSYRDGFRRHHRY